MHFKPKVQKQRSGKEPLKLLSDILKGENSICSANPKEKAEEYLKNLGNYLFSLRNSPSESSKPFPDTKSLWLRANAKQRNMKWRKRRNTTRTDLESVNWKQISSNLIELEKELDSKYPPIINLRFLDKKCKLQSTLFDLQS